MVSRLKNITGCLTSALLIPPMTFRCYRKPFLGGKITQNGVSPIYLLLMAAKASYGPLCRAGIGQHQSLALPKIQIELFCPPKLSAPNPAGLKLNTRSLDYRPTTLRCT